jgi:hypothetical protein
MRGIAGPWRMMIAVAGLLSIVAFWLFSGRFIATVTPAAPGLELPGQLRGPTYAMATQGTRVYLGVGLRLVVLDVADPVNPRLEGQSEPLQTLVRSLAVTGDYAYVLADRVWIFRVSDPAQIVQVASYAPPGSGHLGGLTVSGQYLYVAGLEGLRIVDVSDPANPTEVSQQRTEGVYDREVTVVGSRAYVSGRYGSYPQEQGTVRIVDVSDPLHPRQVGIFRSGFEAYPPGIAVVGQHAYFATAGQAWSWRSGDLQILEVSDPASLKLVAAASIGPSRRVAVSGTVACVTAYNVFRVVDVRDPNNPVQVGGLEITRDGRGVVVQGDHAYVLDEAGLRIINVADPFRPVEVGSMRTAVSGQSNGGVN